MSDSGLIFLIEFLLRLSDVSPGVMPSRLAERSSTILFLSSIRCSSIVKSSNEWSSIVTILFTLKSSVVTVRNLRNAPLFMTEIWELLKAAVVMLLFSDLQITLVRKHATLCLTYVVHAVVRPANRRRHRAKRMRSMG